MGLDFTIFSRFVFSSKELEYERYGEIVTTIEILVKNWPNVTETNRKNEIGRDPWGSIGHIKLCLSHPRWLFRPLVTLFFDENTNTKKTKQIVIPPHVPFKGTAAGDIVHQGIGKHFNVIPRWGGSMGLEYFVRHPHLCVGGGKQKCRHSDGNRGGE